MRSTRQKVAVFTALALLIGSLGSSAMGATGLSIPSLITPSRGLETAAIDYGLRADVSNGEVALSWTGVTAPSGKQLRGYHVYRSTTEADVVRQANQLTEFAITKTSFTDFAGTGVYYYVVQATYTDGGTARASTPLQVNTATVPSGGSVTPRSSGAPQTQIPPLDISSPRSPLLPGGELKIIDNIGSIDPNLLTPIPVAFSAVANRYTGVDPATIFDLNGDLIGDLKVTATEAQAQNGAQLQLIDPAVLSLDQLHLAPAAGYSEKAPLQLSRVYVVQLASGGYAKFMILQATPKVTIWFMYGSQTSSILRADGAHSQAQLSWDALPDAALGYNIYRYEVNDNSYTVIQLNDFTVKETSFTDNTAANRYYLYVVQAIKAGGSPGSLTTTAAVSVTGQGHTLTIGMAADSATIDGARVPMPVAAEIRNGRMMVPASVLQDTGVKVTYDASTDTITLLRRLENTTYTMVLNVGSPDYTWNGTAYKTDVPPYKSGNNVMVSLRLVAPGLGFGLNFNSTDRTASVGWYD